ncbi:hypothetical protein C8Q73DRAFT_710142 [Cubamyces lactineus]|nr:hypothetical protein C8Q73DRAFT_710142 [Cubamyces lactineus]
MSATQVFRCEELATEIFNHFAPGPLRRTDTVQYRIRRRVRQNALARAARICHACTTPALNVLWRVVDNIYILLSLLPPIIRGRPTYVFTRDMTPSEWARFEEYAIRVRELHWQTSPIGFEYSPGHDIGADVEVSPSVWMILARWCQGKGLCPRLEYLAPLHLSPNDPGPLLLVSPTLRHMSISVAQSVLSEDDIALSSLFSSLGSVFASLESLIIDASSQVQSVGNLLMASDYETRLLDLLDTRALRHLEIHPPLVNVSRSFVRICEDIGLRSLSLTIVHFDRSLSFADDPLSRFHSTLRELRLDGEPRSLVDFIEYAIGPSLEKIELRFTNNGMTPLYESRTVLERIVARISPRLTRFSPTLAGDHETTLQEMQQVPAVEIIRPLLTKPHLTHVALHLTYKRKVGLFTQQDMMDLSDAWPDLVELRIDGVQSHIPSNYHAPSPSVEDLIQFAQRHPRLEHLVLPSLNAAAKSLPPLHDIPQLNHQLEVLQIHAITGYPYYRTTFALAQILDKLFPNLDLCRPQFEGPRGFGKKVEVWDDVERALLALQTGRRGGCVV